MLWLAESVYYELLLCMPVLEAAGIAKLTIWSWLTELARFGFLMGELSSRALALL